MCMVLQWKICTPLLIYDQPHFSSDRTIYFSPQQSWTYTNSCSQIASTLFLRTLASFVQDSKNNLAKLRPRHITSKCVLPIFMYVCTPIIKFSVSRVNTNWIYIYCAQRAGLGRRRRRRRATSSDVQPDRPAAGATRGCWLSRSAVGAHAEDTRKIYYSRAEKMLMSAAEVKCRWINKYTRQQLTHDRSREIFYGRAEFVCARSACMRARTALKCFTIWPRGVSAYVMKWPRCETATRGKLMWGFR